jgi:hypothetical protein
MMTLREFQAEIQKLDGKLRLVSVSLNHEGHTEWTIFRGMSQNITAPSASTALQMLRMVLDTKPQQDAEVD